MLSVTVLCLRTLLRNCWRRIPDELYVGRGAFDVELAPYEINLLVLLLWLPVERPSNRSRFAPCGLRGCKNWPAPFPGWMSYKATKPGLLYILACFIVLLFIRAAFYVLLVFVAMCSVFWLFWLSYQYLPSDWLERLLWGSLIVARGSSP